MTRRLRSGLAALVTTATAMLVAALAVCGTAGAQGGGGAPRTTLAANHAASTTLAQNRAAARADAKAMLTLITLPAGATALPAPAVAPVISPTPAAARDETRWHVPGDSFRQALAEVREHRPTDVASSYTESAADRSGLTSLTVGYMLRLPRPGEIDDRILQVTAAADPAGGSIVTVESESVWVVPRTAASAIPAATALITLSVTTPAGRPVSSATLSQPSRVARARAFFDGLEADQPFFLGCPLSVPGDMVTVAFLRRPGTHPLAVARYQEADGGAAGECDAVGLTVDGRHQNSLLSPTYTASLERLFGVRIPSGIVSRSGPAA